MANKLINSTNIKVFPTAYRNDYDPGAKFYSEENIGNILNSIIDYNSVANKQGFVVGKPGTITNGSLITFNLHGYWFRMKFNYSDFSNFEGNKVVAYIEITPDETIDTNNKHLRHATLKNLNDASSDNLDSDGTDPSTSVFGGIKFFDAYQSSENENYQLLIAQKADGIWIVPQQSILKISTLDVLDRLSSADSYESVPVSIRNRFTTGTANISAANIDTGNIDELNVTDDFNLANLEINQDTQMGPAQHEEAVSEKFTITSTSYCALGSYNTGNDKSLRNIYVDATTSGAGNEFAYLQDLGSAGFTIDYIESDSSQPTISEYFSGSNGLTATKLFEVKWDSDNDTGKTTVKGTFTVDGSISGNTLFDNDVKVDGTLLLKQADNVYVNPLEKLGASVANNVEAGETQYDEIVLKNIFGDILDRFNPAYVDNVMHSRYAEVTSLTTNTWNHRTLNSSNNYTASFRTTKANKSQPAPAGTCNIFIEYRGHRLSLGLFNGPATATSSSGNYYSYSPIFQIPSFSIINGSEEYHPYFKLAVKATYMNSTTGIIDEWNRIDAYLIKLNNYNVAQQALLIDNPPNTPAAVEGVSIYFKELA